MSFSARPTSSWSFGRQFLGEGFGWDEFALCRDQFEAPRTKSSGPQGQFCSGSSLWIFSCRVAQVTIFGSDWRYSSNFSKKIAPVNPFNVVLQIRALEAFFSSVSWFPEAFLLLVAYNFPEHDWQQQRYFTTVRAENNSELIPQARKIEFESCK